MQQIIKIATDFPSHAQCPTVCLAHQYLLIVLMHFALEFQRCLLVWFTNCKIKIRIVNVVYILHSKLIPHNTLELNSFNI